LTAGDLILAMKIEPDKVLGLAGIGPKAMQAIEKAVAEAKFEVPIPVEEPVAQVETVEEAVEVVQPEAVSETAVETQQEPAPLEEAEPVVEVPAETAVVEEEEEPEKSFEELFKLRSEIIKPVGIEDDDDKKDKKGKKKKSVELEFDESRGAVVGKKKHKRGDGDWDEEW
jgi:N utilization substance protein A